jgi:hypothetical protein
MCTTTGIDVQCGIGGEYVWLSLLRKIVVAISGFECFETSEAIINQLSSSHQKVFKLS